MPTRLDGWPLALPRKAALSENAVGTGARTDQRLTCIPIHMRLDYDFRRTSGASLIKGKELGARRGKAPACAGCHAHGVVPGVRRQQPLRKLPVHKPTGMLPVVW
jgi:hypothetical protein